MQFELLGYPTDGPTIELDYREFAYAGKFVMSNTGKSLAREGEEVIGAAAFNEDHSSPGTGRIRYVTVRESRRGEGIGPSLLAFTAELLGPEPYDTVTIAVNNPIAYRAAYSAGFEFTGRETGIAELVLRYSPDGERARPTYHDGLERFRDRELPDAQRAILARRDPPELVSPPSECEYTPGRECKHTPGRE